MKRLACGLVSLALSAVGLAAEAVPATYRLDLFHTGGKGVEIFAVDRLRQEPLPWPKEAFEAYERDVQARRKQIRADRRPESEMDALFREEQAHVTKLFGRERYRSAVGAIQGANYDAQAYFRPQLDCIMFTRDQVPFCRVCESALEQVIDSVAPQTARP